VEWFKWLLASLKRQPKVVQEGPPPVLRGPRDEDLLLCRFVKEAADHCANWTYEEPNPGDAWLINANWRVCISFEWRERELTVCVMNPKLHEMYTSRDSSSGLDWLAAYDSCPYIPNMFAETTELVRKFDMGRESEARSKVVALIRLLDSKCEEELTENWRKARAATRARIEAKPGLYFSSFLNEDGTVAVPSGRKPI